ncbi:MAG: ral nucleoside transport system permease protein, partial [Actinomycetota bacterium]|nr:ral nucleoside transport system permease protein [Actinomycetota bacterium]
QARGYALNQFALDALPYVITILVLVVLSRKRLNAAPEGLIRTLANAPVR